MAGVVDISSDQVSTVAVTQGLFVLRYARSTESANNTPFGLVRVSPGSESTVQVISPPGQTQGVLGAPGACLVVISQGSGSIRSRRASVNRGEVAPPSSNS